MNFRSKASIEFLGRDLTAQFRAAESARLRKLRFAKCGMVAAVVHMALYIGIIMASVPWPAQVLALAVLVWGVWGFFHTTR